jgi:hypothetical protein
MLYYSFSYPYNASFNKLAVYVGGYVTIGSLIVWTQQL